MMDDMDKPQLNKGRMLRPGETGIDHDWYKDLSGSDEIEYWLSDLTMHSRASEIAARIVRESRAPKTR